MAISNWRLLNVNAFEVDSFIIRAKNMHPRGNKTEALFKSRVSQRIRPELYSLVEL